MISLSMVAPPALEIFNTGDAADFSDKPYSPHPLQVFPSVQLWFSLCSQPPMELPCPAPWERPQCSQCQLLTKAWFCHWHSQELNICEAREGQHLALVPFLLRNPFQTQFALQLSLQWLPVLLNSRTKLKAWQHARYPYGCSYKSAKFWKMHTWYI